MLCHATLSHARSLQSDERQLMRSSASEPFTDLLQAAVAFAGATTTAALSPLAILHTAATSATPPTHRPWTAYTSCHLNSCSLRQQQHGLRRGLPPA